MNNQANPTRRGAAYLIALLAGTIVTITGLSALSMATSRAKETVLTDQSAGARLLAQSAFEHGLGALSAHLDSGSTRADLTASFSKTGALNDGQFEWIISELDGSAIDNTDGPILLRAKATNGQAAHVIEGILPPSGDPYDVLATGLYVGGELRLSTGSTLNSDQVVGSITEVFATNATINSPVESAYEVNGSTYLGSTTEGQPARAMPDPSLFDYYVALGEPISIASIPPVLGTPTLQDVLLSPNSNPFGDPNPLGIYVIDCGTSDLIIRELRVFGTLVLLNSNGWTVLGNNSLIQPAYPWMPSLLVQGGITFSGTNSGPIESLIGTNLNPVHTPYNMEWDAALDDSYIGGVEGVSYITDDVTFSVLRQNIRGTMIIGGNARIQGGTTVDITYDPGVAHLPPYGFFDDTDGELALDPSTIVWELP